MKRKGPAKPHRATETHDLPKRPPSVEEQLQAALNANASLVRLLEQVSGNLDALRLAILGAMKR